MENRSEQVFIQDDKPKKEKKNIWDRYNDLPEIVRTALDEMTTHYKTNALGIFVPQSITETPLLNNRVEYTLDGILSWTLAEETRAKERFGERRKKFTVIIEDGRVVYASESVNSEVELLPFYT